ncbi:MAG: KEOPS complex subunit Pcc1 [Candidatus Bathyarchaeia archaeon]
MTSRAKCKIRFKDRSLLQTISEALKPEMQKPPTSRSRATLEAKEDCLILNIEARDTAALRAALNAYLRWINSISNVLESLKLEK